MILWGDRLNDTGGRYLIASNVWIATSTANAPEPRQEHTAVWTGSRMIVLGGFFNNGNQHSLSTGGIHDPVADTWFATPMNGAPSVRSGHAAVWTVSEMLIWGGVQFTGGPYLYFNTGSRYNLASNRWSQISTSNAPSPRLRPFAAWTGTEMIIWGGQGTNGSDEGGGARYNPATDTWTPISPFIAPSGADVTPVLNDRNLGAWTGMELAAWPGNGQTGGLYKPATDSWRAMNSSGPERCPRSLKVLRVYRVGCGAWDRLPHVETGGGRRMILFPETRRK